MTPAASGTVAVPGAEIYYETFGSGPAVVFAHGLGGNHLSWWQQVPALAAHHTCITFSHRGFSPSRSERAPDPANFAADLEALLDHLALPSAAIVAQSMGGWTALDFALRHPTRVRRLVLSATVGAIDVAASGRLSRASLADWEARSAHERIRLDTLGIHPACGERCAREQPALHYLYQRIDRLSGALDKTALRARLMAARSVPPDALAALTFPVLCITGLEDLVICPGAVRALAGLLPAPRLEELEDAGHSPYFEHAARFNALLSGFLDEGR